ncbi:MAG TPA: ABC transporter ATP-binding protein, partial [Candidatus Polarisedimenticolaceae bacterium]|nr:ABC transporter ATP-binding protein [Candidatus Polarisedimenticolaceae bacterium]
DRESAGRRRRPPEWRPPLRPRLRVRSLTKVYRGGFPALRGVSFETGPAVVGLLGPNGAGKTTLLRLLMGLLEPTRGRVELCGVAIGPHNLPEYRRHIGCLPQEFHAYPGFSAEQFLEYWALEQGLEPAALRERRIGELLERVGLGAHGRRKVRDFSGGMRQRIGIARALLEEPPLLVVDEPTTGLDIEARAGLREALLAAGRDRVVILSTHIATDVEATASRLLVLHGGRLRWDGSPEGLIAEARGRVFEACLSDREHREFGGHHRITARVRQTDGLHVRALAADGQEAAGPLVEPTLEEAYLVAIDRLAGGGQSAARRGGTLHFLDRGR